MFRDKVLEYQYYLVILQDPKTNKEIFKAITSKIESEFFTIVFLKGLNYILKKDIPVTKKELKNLKKFKKLIYKLVDSTSHANLRTLIVKPKNKLLLQIIARILLTALDKGILP